MNIADYNAVVPQNIESIINARGLKKGAVASRAGYSKQQFSDMLNGRKIIKLCDVMAIADSLGVEVQDLYTSGQKGR